MGSSGVIFGVPGHPDGIWWCQTGDESIWRVPIYDQAPDPDWNYTIKLPSKKYMLSCYAILPGIYDGKDLYFTLS